MHRVFSLTSAIAALCGFAFASTAAAEDTSNWQASGSAALVSDYLFRGISQTGQDPALQAGIEFAHISGFYAGTWGSNVSWVGDLSTDGAPISNSLEVDFYAGWRGQLGAAVKVDLAAYTYAYPGDYPQGFTRPHTTEVIAGITWSLLQFKYSHSVSNAFGFADSHNSGYLEANLNWEFVPSWTLNAHLGHQRINGLGDASYSDERLGVTHVFGGAYSLALTWSDTNAERSIYTNPQGEFLARSTGVLSLTRTF
ncbi:MAG: TorF family putative porin [Tahibacter sp.]